MWFRFQPALKIISLKISMAGLKTQIQARPTGFLAALAHLFGVGSTHTLAISRTGLRKDVVKFSGENKVYVPRRHISSSIYIASKPVEYVASALSIFFLGMGMSATLSGTGRLIVILSVLAVAALLVVLYFLTARRTTIGIITDAGTAETIRLKASGSELQDLRDVCEIIETLIRSDFAGDEATSQGSVESSPRSRPREPDRTLPPSRSPAVEDEVIACPHCGSRMQVSAAYRGKQVRCPACRDVVQA